MSDTRFGHLIELSPRHQEMLMPASTDVVIHGDGSSRRARSGKILLGDIRYDPTDPVCLYLADLTSEESQRTMYRCLRQFARWFCDHDEALPEYVHWREVRHADVLEYQLYLQYKPVPTETPGATPTTKALSLATQNLYVIAVRNVLKKACRISSVVPHKRIDAQVYQEICEIKLRAGKRLAKTRALTDTEFDVFWDSFTQGGRQQHNKNIRDRALFLVMIGAGLRVNELVTMDWPNNVIDNFGTIRIIGKGNKEREVPLNADVASALRDYIEQLRGDGPGPLWHPISKAGQLDAGRRLTPGGVRKMMRFRGCELTEVITPHYLRKTFGTRLLQHGVDIFTAQELLGHASADTTKIYDTRGKERKVEAVNVLVRKTKTL